ncbi:hypothetical protein DUNSADRAFT_2202 [Dunaliella salina]|uniref:Encoded protein n=1 Tax=Dunaliella salina TaxID=3046 RepID=A0ABQ7GW24_DUNSA|nr:hypothetical protein DUNSADRAFT_2202 [Dunaliella salina]|eukprot:KAF5838817.1 hypothetical protein DUNSADRAFT_2202 [Dunaliella salina]
MPAALRGRRSFCCRGSCLCIGPQGSGGRPAAQPAHAGAHCYPLHTLLFFPHYYLCTRELGAQASTGSIPSSSLGGNLPVTGTMETGSASPPKMSKADPFHPSVFESIAGHLYDPIIDGLRQIDSRSPGLPAPIPHAITRKALLLKVPVVDEALRLDIPALVEDRSGHTCLVILPSDKPPGPGEASTPQSTS